MRPKPEQWILGYAKVALLLLICGHSESFQLDGKARGVRFPSIAAVRVEQSGSKYGSHGLVANSQHIRITDNERNVEERGRREFCSDLQGKISVLWLAQYPSSRCNALSPEEAATKYDAYASAYDDLDGGDASSKLGIDEARASLLKMARGNVLEIGVGTGLNLDKYVGTEISSLTLVDISDGMLQKAKERIGSIENLRSIPVKFVTADATSELVDMFGRCSFDTVLDSFSLCVMGNEGAKRCLNQIAQVVKTKENAGKVLLLENSRSSNPFLGLYQDATADAAAKIGGKGCVYNQNVAELISSGSDMEIVDSTDYAMGLFRSFVCTTK